MRLRRFSYGVCENKLIKGRSYAIITLTNRILWRTAMLENIPSHADMAALLGQPLSDVWQKLCGAIDEKYEMERLWNTGGKNWTYEYKYRRGGKALCCLYAKSSRMGFMIVFGKDERAKFEEIRGTLSEAVCRQFDEAKTITTGNGSCLSRPIPLNLTITSNCWPLRENRIGSSNSSSSGGCAV